MNESPRQLRLSSTARGVAIGAILLVYGLLVRQSPGTFIEGLLIAAAVQAGVLLLRRFAPGALVPMGVFILELIADGVTVLLFAIGVFSAIGAPMADM